MIRRLPVYLLLDTSGSMAGDPIEAVKDGMRSLIFELQLDPQAQETAYLSVITFASSVRQVAPLTEISAFSEPVLEAHGSTCLGVALKVLQECYDKEVIKKTTETQRGDYQPLVFLMTDGRPTDDWEKIADEIGAIVRKGEVYARFVALGAGGSADTTVLKRLTDDVFLMPDMSTGAWTRLFLWVSQLIKTGSKSAVEGVGGSQPLPPPPPDINIVP
jgi:uncharacterized protein YegL